MKLGLHVFQIQGEVQDGPVTGPGFLRNRGGSGRGMVFRVNPAGKGTGGNAKVGAGLPEPANVYV